MLTLNGKPGDTKYISNLGTEIVIKILDIKNNYVTFEIVCADKISSEFRDEFIGTSESIFMRKQAD